MGVLLFYACIHRYSLRSELVSPLRLLSWLGYYYLFFINIVFSGDGVVVFLPCFVTIYVYFVVDCLDQPEAPCSPPPPQEAPYQGVGMHLYIWMFVLLF